MFEITKDMIEVFTFNAFTEIAHEAPSHCIHVYFDKSVKKFKYTITDAFNDEVCYDSGNRTYGFNDLILDVNHTIEYYLFLKINLNLLRVLFEASVFIIKLRM